MTGRKQPQERESTNLDLEALKVKLTELETNCTKTWTKESSERTSDIIDVRSNLKKLETKMNESKLRHPSTNMPSELFSYSFGHYVSKKLLARTSTSGLMTPEIQNCSSVA